MSWELHKNAGFAIWWTSTRTAIILRPGGTSRFVSVSASSPRIGTAAAKTLGGASDVSVAIKVGMYAMGKDHTILEYSKLNTASQLGHRQLQEELKNYLMVL